jgi:Rrf2 family iron-sulfur cluster assembly transcriptional regulator
VRLKLTKRGDYAIRAMLGLARAGKGQRLSAHRIAEEQGIPRHILPRIMSDLVRAGLVVSSAGRSGGYELTLERSTISILAVIEAIEGDGRRTTCILRGGPCGRDGVCDVHSVFFAAQEALLSTLADTTLEELAPSV